MYLLVIFITVIADVIDNNQICMILEHSNKITP